MEKILFLLLLFPAVVVIQYIRFKLTRWEKFAEDFESEKRLELKPIYGFWSEFRYSPKSYPWGNKLLKLGITNFGLYLQYNLKYEPIKFYKPVMIPWSYITISQTKESKSKGGDEYIIRKNEKYLGSVFLQSPISEQIKNRIKELDIRMNYINDK